MITNAQADHIKFNADMESDMPTPAMITSKPDLAPLERLFAEFGNTAVITETGEFTRDELAHMLSGLIQAQIMSRTVPAQNDKAIISAMAKVRVMLESFK